MQGTNQIYPPITLTFDNGTPMTYLFGTVHHNQKTKHLNLCWL